MPNELWSEVRDIIQETGIRTMPKIKKFKKAKWLSEEASQIAEKRREAKGKGKKERYTHLSICAAEVNRYTHLNAEFQRICKER